MASSVASMPADEWRDSGRRAAGVFGSHHPFARNLRKVLVRPEKRQGSPEPSPSPSPSTAPATMSRQSQILDRWAAWQAKEVITTIERKANEAEISALSVTSQPVSARAATFIRDTSPAPSDSSSSVASSPGPGVDLPPNVRASSLIQMWREIEAEAGVPPPTPRSARGVRGGGSDESETFGDWESDATATSESERGRVVNIVRMLSGTNTASLSGSEEIETMSKDNLVLDHRDYGIGVRSRGRREIEGLMARLEQERRRELDELMERRAVSQFPHRRRLQSFLRFIPLRRELAAQGQPRPAPRTSKLDRLQRESIILPIRQMFNRKDQHDGSGPPAAESSSRFRDQSLDRSYTCAADQLNVQISNHGSEYRSNEVLDVASSRNSPVQHCDNSEEFDQFLQQQFNKRGRHDLIGERAAGNLSSFLAQFPNNSKHCCLTRQISNCGNQYDAIENPATKKSISPQVQLLDSSQGSGYICTVNQLSEQFNHTGHSDGNGKATTKSSSNLHVRYVDNSQISDNSRTADQIAPNNSQHPDVPFPRDAKRTSPEVSPHSSSEELQEGTQSTCKSWDGGNLWLSDIDLLRPLNTSTSQSMEGDVIIEEIETSAEKDISHSDSTWISETANSREGRGVSQHRTSPCLLENFSDKLEIREILERRRVTTVLASDFPEKMNRLITSFLRRQGRSHVDGDEYDEQFFSRQNHEYHNADQAAVASAASSLIPKPYQIIFQADSWHDTREGLSQHLQEVYPVQDLRSDVAEIHHEIYELRKLVESCMDWQRNLLQSIKQEVASAVYQSVRMGDNSNWTPTRKGICCICREMSIDSLLYRCGHMCTCFKCANDLQWSSGRCPICKASIIDVVRAYANS